MDEKYKVIVSDRSRQMLGAHVRFLAEKSPNAARETQKRILEAIRSLHTMPARFPFLTNEYITPNKYRKMFVENWYLVLYQIREDAVYVDYVVDCRQDYEWLLR
jgi:plasmid stabilization system protein ParE